MGEFRFKRFTVKNERSAMKVNTDGVLLGAAMTVLPTDSRLLDIGTGTGTIALMAAQRLSDMRPCDTPEPFFIDAIDIDEPSATEAGENFAASPWASSLRSVLCDLKDYRSDGKYDLIFSNPPYFDDSLVNPFAREASARHTLTLSYREIFLFASENLSPEGRVALVLPTDCFARLCREARSRGLFLQRVLRIRTTAKKQPLRMVVEFSRSRNESPVEELLTMQENGRYTDEYTGLVKFFYMFC